MISTRYRIHKSRFPSVLKGFSINEHYFRAILSPQSDLKNPKIAVIISKKHSGRAVDRNFYRRLIFSAIQPLLAKLPLKNIVVMATQKLPYYNQDADRITEIKKDIYNLFHTLIAKYEKST
jgi:ribonuclease P protein component